MKVWLDDIRNEPEGWIRCKTAYEVIELLNKGGIEIISLDHDLGENTEKTGADVTRYMTYLVFSGKANLVPMDIRIHSANPVGRKNMEMDIHWISKNR